MTTATKPVTLDHLMSKKKPVIRKVWIAGDDEVAEQFEDLVKRRDNLRTLHRLRPDDKVNASDLAICEKQVEEMEKEYRKTALKFIFRSIGRVKFDKLVKDHPPTSVDLEEAEKVGVDPKELQWNSEGFSVALVAACSVEPKMTVAEVRSLFDNEDWTQVESAALFSAALSANLERRAINLDAVGNGSRGTTGSS